MRHARIAVALTALTLGPIACHQRTSPASESVESPTQLLLSGSIDSSGITLAPAYMLDTRSSPPDNAGDFSVDGLDASGASLFRYMFTPAEVAHLPGTRHLAFALPLTDADRRALITIRVTGPNRGNASRASPTGSQNLPAPARSSGSDAIKSAGFSLERASSSTVQLRYDSRTWAGVMVRDPETREVIAFATGGALLIASQAPSLLLTFSDGVQSVSRLVSLPR